MPQVKMKVKVEVVWDELTAVESPVLTAGWLEGSSLTGAAWSLDLALGHRLSRALEQGSMSGRLGQLYLLPVPGGSPAPLVAELVVLAGMGRPELFGRDELRMLFTNLTAAVVDLGYSRFATPPVGTGSGLSCGEALRALLEGVAAGLKRVPAPPNGAHPTLIVTFVERQELRAWECWKALKDLKNPPGEIDLVFKPDKWREPVVGRSKKQPRDDPSTDTDPQDPSLRVSVLQADPPSTAGEQPFVRFQFSALFPGAVLPVREVEAQRYFTERLAEQFARPVVPDRTDDEGRKHPFGRIGRLLSAYLLPEDIRKAMADAEAVTLTVDRRTAPLPWEMADLTRRTPGDRPTEPRFLGIAPGVCRQFRTPAEVGPANPPPLNHTLRVLVIADPTGDLPEAGAEGLAVVRTFEKVRDGWAEGNTELKLVVDVRIGPPAGAGVYLQVARALTRGRVVRSARPCDPMEVLALIADVEYDVIHFAGHGAEVGGRSGWRFADGCVFSAVELIRSRLAPRLVFANACHSGGFGADARERQLSEQAGLAEGFLARGVHNYIGTGWAVSDRPARLLAETFYRELLTRTTAPPGVLGVALLKARNKVYREHRSDPTWGAYQHYGRWNDKLIDLPNR